MVDISVVVPAYDEADTIGRTLDSLRGQDAEVIVVVDGEDGTRSVAERHYAVDAVIEGEGAGPGAARNRGAEHAAGDVLLFTDGDTMVPEDWVENHRRHYADADVVGTGGPARPIENSLKDRVLFKLLSDYWYRVSWPLGFVQQPGFNCGFRRDAFVEAEGFNEGIPFMEDTELSLRMKAYGDIAYDADTEVATSARREADEGYLSLFTKYARAYLDYYVLDREMDGDYFDAGTASRQ